MDLDLAEFRKITITVNGILEQSVKNTYTINGNSTIYLPYEYMINAMEKSKGRGTASSCETYQMKEWEPSAVVIYADSYKEVKVVENKINRLTPDIVTRYAYRDTEEIEKMASGLRVIINVAVVVVLVIIFALMCAVYINTTVGRKREYAILKAMGFSLGRLRDILKMKKIRKN